MANSERSAGIIIFRTAPMLSGSQREYLLLNNGRFWDFPKGHVDPGETDFEAAIRELREETGIADPTIIHHFIHEIRYFFRAKKTIVEKTVIFFLASTDVSRVEISDEHVGYEFLTLEKALQRVTYANAREILRLADAHLVQIGT